MRAFRHARMDTLPEDARRGTIASLNGKSRSSAHTPRQQDLSLTREQQVYAIKTWRYLRLAMIALLVGLFAAVIYEVARGGDIDCVQTSISAYYYTHAQAIFVGALIAMGTCLISLRGSTDHEDVLLNLAGMLAPVVALVPTPNAGACASLVGLGDPTPNVENNITALLFTGATAFVLLAVLSRGSRRPAVARIGYWVAIALWGIALVVFIGFTPEFVDHAHLIAAGIMFACIIAVAVINAFSFRDKQGDPNVRNRYIYIAIAMLSAPALYLVGGMYHILLAEIAALLLFAIFWAFQTEELWGEGVRLDPEAEQRHAAEQDG